MFTEINQEIFELKEKLRIKEKLETLRNMVSDELKIKNEQAKVLEDMLAEEEKDVLKLEELSISSIFFSIIGKKEDKLDKEREEYLTAKLKYEECLESIKELRNKLESTNKQLLNYSGVKEEYDILIKEKEKQLLNDGTDRGRVLQDNLNNINELKLDINEIKEAILAGEKTKNALSKMSDQLTKAKDWGMWDMMGGGLISNIAKHNAIDEANKIAHESQDLIKLFQKELSDVDKFTDVNVNLSTFETFADFFFDGFFVDWFVQSKINDSLQNVDNAYNRINDIVLDLRSNLEILESKLKGYQAKVKDMMEL